MKILLIENVWMGTQQYGLFDKTLLTAFSILPTLYTRQLQAITPAYHQTTLVNERYTPIPFSETFDLVNINYTTSTAPHAYTIADTFKKQQVPVVLSGMHASALPQEALQHADAVLLGRGELSWPTLLNDFEHHQLKKIYDAVPYPTNTHLPATNIDLPGFVITGAIEATRGCPYNCNFCPEVNIPGGSFYYKRPIADVINELKDIPQKTIQFYDSSLTIDTAYTKELFTAMQGLGKRFFCNGNVSTLAQDTELIKLSQQAGCIAWLIGFESIQQPTLEAIGKTTNQVHEYQNAIDLLHKHHMLVIGCFIFGFDTDTPSIFDETLQIIRTLGVDVADFCALTPFPGTPIFDELQKQDRLRTMDWGQYNLKNAVFTPKQMSAEQLENGIRYMYTQFYNPVESIKRITPTIGFGLYPFGATIARNIVAISNSQKLRVQPLL